jgi:molybdate transport system permease protein
VALGAPALLGIVLPGADREHARGIARVFGPLGPPRAPEPGFGAEPRLKMDWQALSVSLQLGVGTVLILLPFAMWAGHLLATRRFRGKAFVEALVAIPLVLPPTVLGFYLLVTFGVRSPLGGLFEDLVGQALAFSFPGLLLASAIANIPFAVHPIQRGFEAVPTAVREAAACCGLTPWQRFLRIDLPLAWPGILTAVVLTFAHTLGEFGVVLMVGGNIPGETRTLSIAIYDRMQAFDDRGAGIMAAVLLAVAVAALTITTVFGRRVGRSRV